MVASETSTAVMKQLVLCAPEPSTCVGREVDGVASCIHNENRGVIGVNGTVIAGITTRNILLIWGRVWISVGDVLMFETKLLKLQ
jgi:hypothetical protein